MTPVYLDHNATTPPDPRVCDAVAYWLGRPANASSTHAYGRAAREAVDAARGAVAGLVGVQPEAVVFTSGGTEADDLALHGLLDGRDGALVVSAVEHAAVRETAQQIAATGRRVIELPVDGSGRIDTDFLAAILAAEPIALVSVMWANNETGVLSDIDAIVGLCRGHGVPVHSDAVQAVGKVPVDFRAAGLAAMSVSAHKLHGPQGVGALVLDRAWTLIPRLVGGGQQRGLRGGTEPVAAIAGFGVAAEVAGSLLAAEQARQSALRTRLECALAELPRVTVLGAAAPRLPNTVQFTVDGIEGEALLFGLDRAGYAVSSGSACASGGKAPSHVLVAMGVATDAARGVVRVSLGRGNDAAQMDGFVAALARVLDPDTGMTGGAVGGW